MSEEDVKDVVISLWQEMPEADGNDYGFCFRAAGTCSDGPWCVDGWFEFDGRDAEFTPVWGCAGPYWEFVDSLCKIAAFMAAFNEAGVATLASVDK